MKKEVILVLLLVVLCGCTNISEETTQDIVPDKTTGGVIICDADYPCGNADNICPEDYGAICKFADPDCNAQ